MYYVNCFIKNVKIYIRTSIKITHSVNISFVTDVFSLDTGRLL